MKKIIFDLFLSLLTKLFKKKVLYISNTYRSPTTLAAKSKYGFWYCGDVFNQSDIAYGIASHGMVESYDTEMVMSILKTLPSDFIFYDIGSNTGWYTMIALTAHTKSTVYSFEPLVEHIACQKETVHLNSKESRVHIFETALSNHNGIETIRLAGSGTSLEKDFLEKDLGTRTIEIKTLDSLIKKEELSLPHFIKIDVEGHEYKVIQGALSTITEAKPILFIEVAYSLKGLHRKFINKDFTILFETLSSLGYKSYLLKDDSVTPYTDSVHADGVYMYLFLNEKTHLQESPIKNLLHLS